jgi:hypothetical protein
MKIDRFYPYRAIPGHTGDALIGKKGSGLKMATVDGIPDFIQCLLGPEGYQRLVDQAYRDIETGNLSCEKEEFDS